MKTTRGFAAHSALPPCSRKLNRSIALPGAPRTPTGAPAPGWRFKKQKRSHGDGVAMHVECVHERIGTAAAATTASKARCFSAAGPVPRATAHSRRR